MQKMQKYTKLHKLQKHIKNCSLAFLGLRSSKKNMAKSRIARIKQDKLNFLILPEISKTSLVEKSMNQTRENQFSYFPGVSRIALVERNMANSRNTRIKQNKSGFPVVSRTALVEEDIANSRITRIKQRRLKFLGLHSSKKKYGKVKNHKDQTRRMDFLVFPGNSSKIALD